MIFAPVRGGHRERGVPSDSATLRSDGMHSVGTGRAEGAGAITTAGAGRSRRGGSGFGPCHVRRMVEKRRRANRRLRNACGSGCSWARSGGDQAGRRKSVRVGGLPGGEGAGAVGAVVKAESSPCEVLVTRIACSGIAAASAGASARPLPPSEGMEQSEAKAVFVVGKISPRAGRRSAVVTEADAQATNLPKGTESWPTFIPYVAWVRREVTAAHSDGPIGAGHHQPTQGNQWGRRRTSAKLTGSEDEDTAVIDENKAARLTALVSYREFWRAGHKKTAVLMPPFFRHSRV